MYVIPRRYVTRLPIDFTKIWDKNAIFFDEAIEENDEIKLQSWGVCVILTPDKIKKGVMLRSAEHSVLMNYSPFQKNSRGLKSSPCRVWEAGMLYFLWSHVSIGA